MAELTQIVNGEYIGADKYTITDTSDGKKQIVFSPDSVLEQGTPVGAEILNEIQKNGLYYLVGTHRVNGQESIYDCTLVGIDTFDFTQLNVLFKPNTSPTQATVKLNISGQIFTLAEKLINANQIGLLLVKSEMKAYTWGTKIAIVNDLTTGGTDKAGSAEMVKKLNDDKVSKSGDTMTGSLEIDSTQETNNAIIIKNNGAPGVNIGYRKGSIDEAKYAYIYNGASRKQIRLLDNGSSEYPANNLKTPEKEVIGAINGIVDNLPNEIKYHSTYIPERDHSDITKENFWNVEFWRNRKERMAYVGGEVADLPTGTTYILIVIAGVDVTAWIATDCKTGKTYTASANSNGSAKSGWYKEIETVFISQDGTTPYPKGFSKDNCTIIAIWKPKSNRDKEFIDIVTRTGDGVVASSHVSLTDSGIRAEYIPNFVNSAYGFVKGMYVTLRRVDW